ncbi:T-complex protein 1 subunit delta [Nematocida homosporus]|uniref:T-complex protein 1 subunit delta n=1 Tax=Nematocida homosporus TaxID=1912981 RepID=UPI00221EAAFF|nr:T-complex protein 1 subunit delta [Nematocida homosporus]KAI5186485.1 T-complex protein 1 subunit delta [Nematocida homosporus]
MKQAGSRAEEVRRRIISVTQSIRSTMGTSLGPKGMDKMITQGNQTTITNDGSTILKMMKMKHPIAQLICNISHSQDEQSGDGTTSITLLLCSLVEAASALIDEKIHPVVVANAMERAKSVCKEALTKHSVEAKGQNDLRDCIRISLNSKIVSAYIEAITEVTMQAIQHTVGPDGVLPLQNIRRIKIKGNMEEIKMVPGIVLSMPLKRKVKFMPRKMKVAILQCAIGQSKPNLDAKLNVGNYEAMEAVVREEKAHVLALCKTIKDLGLDLLIIQKSIVRESLSELALHFLDRLGVLVVDDVERKEVELCAEQLSLSPVVDINEIKESMVGEYLVEDLEGYVKIQVESKVCTVILRGTDEVILEEVDRSFNDAINVGRLMSATPRLIAGGGVPELVCCTALAQYNDPKLPKVSYCVRELAKALLVVPEMLAVNAGAEAISTLECLLKAHAQGPSDLGVSVRAVGPGSMQKENVIQPLGVSLSGISGALDGAAAIVRIDDFIPAAK